MSIMKRLLGTIFWGLARQEITVGGRRFKRSRLFPNPATVAPRHSEDLDDVLRALLESFSGAFIDAGVNTGQTLMKVLAIDPSRRYVGFEPQVACCFYVEQFLFANRLSGCAVLPLALSNRNAPRKMYLRGAGVDALSSSVASVVDRFRPGEFYTASKLIYTIRGDDVLPSLGVDTVSVIKIDVEGAEVEVIEGLANCIETHRPILVFEVLHHYLIVTRQELDDETIGFREERLRKLEALIRGQGYDVYSLHGLEEIRKIAAIRPERRGDNMDTNYVAVPHEKDSTFRDSIARTRRIVSEGA